MDLLSSQAKVKYLNAAREGKYKLLSKSQRERSAERLRQQEKLQSLQAIVERLEEEFPGCRDQLRNISLSLKTRLVDDTIVKPMKELEVT